MCKELHRDFYALRMHTYIRVCTNNRLLYHHFTTLKSLLISCSFAFITRATLHLSLSLLLPPSTLFTRRLRTNKEENDEIHFRLFALG